MRVQQQAHRRRVRVRHSQLCREALWKVLLRARFVALRLAEPDQFLDQLVRVFSARAGPERQSHEVPVSSRLSPWLRLVWLSCFTERRGLFEHVHT